MCVHVVLTAVQVQVLTDSQRHKFSMAAAASGQSHLSPPYQPQISTSFEEQASENLQADSTAPANDHEVVLVVATVTHRSSFSYSIFAQFFRNFKQLLVS